MSAAAAATTAKQLLMTVHESIKSIRSMRKKLPSSLSVGYVPTMGALHDGHLSLVKEARSKNDVVIASIFVNPTQFGKGEDLDKYPRQMEQDSKLLQEFGVDHLFAPNKELMYGKNHMTFVDPIGFDDIPEGVSRPGHFRGVATVVTKLFNIVQPTNAYFGQKDAAQCTLIRRIVDDLNMDVNVQVLDTIRETDGLAMSSRNAYLTPKERMISPVVYKSLCAAKQFYHMIFLGSVSSSMEEEEDDGKETEGKEFSIPSNTLRDIVEEVLRSEPLVTDIQYVSVDDRETMRPIDVVGKDGAVISLACKVGSVRLIDNIVLKIG